MLAAVMLAFTMIDAGALPAPDDPPNPTGDWSPAAAQVVTPDAPPTDGKWIEVDLRTQTLRAKVGDHPVMTAFCSTGRNNATPRGRFPIREKRRENLALPEYGSAPIPFSLRLDVVVGGQRHLIAIHAHSSVPRYPASHGCIRLRLPDARRLFEWADVGTLVAVK